MLFRSLRTFRLPRRVDLAVVPLDSLGYLYERADLLAFFRSARRCLARRGILAVDLTLHPERRSPLPIRSAWNVNLRPTGRLKVNWRSQGRAWGAPPRRWEVARMTASLRGGVRQVFWEAHPHAVLTARVLRDLAREAGGFGAMTVYSAAAHRPARRGLRPVTRLDRIEGSRLVCWPRM